MSSQNMMTCSLGQNLVPHKSLRSLPQCVFFSTAQSFIALLVGMLVILESGLDEI